MAAPQGPHVAFALGIAGVSSYSDTSPTGLEFHPYDSVKLKYWVGQTVCTGFSVRYYGKTPTNLLANPIPP